MYTLLLVNIVLTPCMHAHTHIVHAYFKMLLVNVFHSHKLMYAVMPSGNGESYDDANVDSVSVIYVVICIFQSRKSFSKNKSINNAHSYVAT